MNKLLLVAATALVASLTLNSTAQTTHHPKNILSVRAGLSVTNFGFADVRFRGATQDKAGFQVEVVDQISLSRSIPLYLETGLFAVEKGAASLLFDYKTVSSYYYVGVPLMVNYRWSVGSKFTIDPQLGFFYAYMVGVSSNGKPAEMSTINNVTNRSDFGLRVAVGATYNDMFSFRIGYDASFLSIVKAVPGIETPAITNGSLFITLGFNFITIK